jgi:small-conductance mechanosensitive channel
MPGIWWTNKEIEDIATTLKRIEKKLDQVLVSERKQTEMIMSEQEEVANLVAQVNANKDVLQSATVAIGGMLDKIATLSQELQDAIAAGGTDVSADIKTAADELQANTVAFQQAVPQMAAAVKANTTK